MSTDASASTPSSPATSETSLSSLPSPTLSTLSLSDVKEVLQHDAEEAAKLKAGANKAFIGARTRRGPLSHHPD
jgi:hypothetical protein